MLSLRALAAVFLLLITGCQERKAEQATAKLGPSAVALRPVVDTSRVAVFPYDEERDKYIFSNVKAAELLPKELASVAALLEASIKDHNRAQAVELEDMRKIMHKNHPNVQLHEERYLVDLADYKRQLVVVTNPKGEKIVWVNCFCREENQANWRRRIVSVDDGGNCYFNVKLNLTRQIWYDLMVNGIA